MKRLLVAAAAFFSLSSFGDSNAQGDLHGSPVLAGSVFSENQACSGSCTRASAPATTSDGINLQYVRAVTLRICAVLGQTLSGAGTMQAYHCDSRLSPVCSRVGEMDKAVPAAASGQRCWEFQPFSFAGMSSYADSYDWASSSVTVSGGATLAVTIVPGY